MTTALKTLALIAVALVLGFSISGLIIANIIFDGGLKLIEVIANA